MTVAIVGNHVAKHSGRIIIGDISLYAKRDGVSSVVQIAQRFRAENRGIGAHGNAHIDEIRVLMQRSRVRNFEAVQGEGGEHGRLSQSTIIRNCEVYECITKFWRLLGTGLFAELP